MLHVLCIILWDGGLHTKERHFRPTGYLLAMDLQKITENELGCMSHKRRSPEKNGKKRSSEPM